MRRSLVLSFLIVTLLLSMATTILAADRLQQILDRKSIRIGIMLVVPPFGQYDKQNQPAGFDVDLANKIADSLKVKLEIVPVLAANRIPYLVSDKVDLVVGTFSRTAERTLVVDYSVPYIKTGPAVMVRADETKIKSVASLGGTKCAILKGTTGALWAKKLAPKDTQFVEYDMEPDQLLGLIQGKVDSLVQDETIMSAWVDQNPGKVKVVGDLFYGDYLAVGIKKGEHDLKSWVDWFLFEQHNLGVIKELWDKWFKIPMRDPGANPFF